MDSLNEVQENGKTLSVISEYEIYEDNEQINEHLFNTGLLFQINRLILHPFGMSLVLLEGKGLAVIKFKDVEFAKYEVGSELENRVKLYQDFLLKEGNSKKNKRKEILGFTIQPIEGVIDEDAVNNNVKSDSKHVKKGAAYRNDLKSETPSILSKLTSSTLEEEDEPRRKIDLSKYKVINSTRLTKDCVHPEENINYERLTSGGSMIFCSLCGAQFTDSDLRN